MIVRTDLPLPHLVCQAVHSAISVGISYGYGGVEQPHLVICAASGEEELLAEFERAKAEGVPVCLFREEDMGDAPTAFATAPLSKAQRRALRHLKLLR